MPHIGIVIAFHLTLPRHIASCLVRGPHNELALQDSIGRRGKTWRLPSWRLLRCFIVLPEDHLKVYGVGEWLTVYVNCLGQESRKSSTASKTGRSGDEPGPSFKTKNSRVLLPFLRLHNPYPLVPPTNYLCAHCNNALVSTVPSAWLSSLWTRLIPLRDKFQKSLWGVCLRNYPWNTTLFQDQTFFRFLHLSLVPAEKLVAVLSNQVTRCGCQRFSLPCVTW